jgi:hypothetical protein
LNNLITQQEIADLWAIALDLISDRSDFDGEAVPSFDDVNRF